MPLQSPFNLDFIVQSLHFESIDSTSSHAKSMSDLPDHGIILITADRQTAGRGQKGNTFFSNHPGGIWCTIIQPIPDISVHFTYNRALSLGIADAVSSLPELKYPAQPSLKIKWPNDIYWGDKKLCGILLESHPSSPRHIIIGFGLNVTITLDDFPSELRAIATSIFIETGIRADTAFLLEAILQKYHAWSTTSPETAHAEYERRLYGMNRPAIINGRHGRFTGVREDGHALLEREGIVSDFSSGPLCFD